jgi:ankyrin repeat protein
MQADSVILSSQRKAANARVLLELGAEVNATSAARITAIHGVRCEETELLDLLLAHGADINATYGDGRTLLHRQIDHNPRLSQAWLRHLKSKGLDFSLRWRDFSYSEYAQQRRHKSEELARLVQESDERAKK